MKQYDMSMHNIHDWGDLKVGDKVEYVRLQYGSGSLEHGQTTITYKCNAYLELSNGEVLDGFSTSEFPYVGLIVGGKMFPSAPMRATIKKTLAKLQKGGRSLAEPYHRVMRILGESVGFALVEDKGAYHYKEAHEHKKTNRMGETTKRVKYDPIKFTAEDYNQPTRFTHTWKELEREAWLAYQRRRKFIALDPPVHWTEERADIRDVLTGLGAWERQEE